MVISCSKEIVGPDNDVPVSFNTWIDEGTKVESYFLPGEKMGLFGYNLNDGTTWEESGLSLSPDYMYNVPLEYTGNDWITDEFYFWSPNPLNRKRFYAYYPYADNGENENISVSSDIKGAPYLDFKLTDGKTDFITCSAKEGNIEDPIIRFTAKHALAKLSIGFATDISVGFAYVRALKVSGILMQGTFKFDKTNGDGFVYNGNETTGECVLPQISSGDICIESNDPLYIEDYELYLLPPETTDGKGGISEIEVVINGVHKTINLKSVPLRAGKNTMINIVINQKEVKFHASIGPWKDGGSVNDTID